MIPQSIIEAIAAHNKKGNADAIDTANYAVKTVPLTLPYTGLLDCPGQTALEALDDFASNCIAAVGEANKASGEVLGYSILTVDSSGHGDVLILNVFIGKALTPEQKEIRKALAELSEADRLEYNNMLTALRKVLSPAAFDAYRKALSLAGVTRNQWNQEQNKGRIPRYTGPADGNVVFYPGTRFSEPEKKS